MCQQAKGQGSVQDEAESGYPVTRSRKGSRQAKQGAPDPLPNSCAEAAPQERRKQQQQQQQTNTGAGQSSVSADLGSSYSQQQEDEDEPAFSSVQPSEHSHGPSDSDAAEYRTCSTDDHSVELDQLTWARNQSNSSQGTNLGEWNPLHVSS